MLNVNALQKTLSAMSLPDIQKYAQLHKNDPYVVAMALSVANTKKEAQTAQQGLAAMQPMPKVAEQDIQNIAPHAAVPAMGAAQPLPESVGIGQLPAQNMQRMAGGGIVAFDDGGPVWDPMTGEWVNEGETPYSGLGEYVGKKAEDVKNWTAEKTNWKKGLNIDPAGAFAPKVAAPQNISEPAPAVSTAGAGRGSYAGYNPLQAAANAGNKLPPAPDKKAPPTGAPSVGVPQTGLGGFMDYLKANQPAAPEDMDAYMKRRESYLGENPTKKQMERIDKQEVQALADKEEAKSMALIKAGLSMMAGTSRYAMENIGKGALAGVEDYALSQKDAKKMALERDKMRDAIENAAFAYKKGDLDSYEKYAQDAKNARNTYAAHGLAALGSVTGHQISADATRFAATTSAGATKDYLNAIRGGSLIETTRKDIAAQIAKAMPYATDAERTAAFDREWQKAVQANPILAKLSGSATGGGGAPDTSGLKLVGVR